MSEILVLCEHRRGALREVSFELLALGRRLAGGERAVCALLLGHGAAVLGEKLCAAADRVLLVEDAGLDAYDAEPYLAALEAVILARRPALLLVAHSAVGMDLAPALAARAGLPLVTDCLDVQLAQGALEVVRRELAGKVGARLRLAAAGTHLVTVRPGCFPAAPQGGKAAAVERLPAPDRGSRRGRRLLGYADLALGDVDISAAPVLVAVGRGVGKPENLAAVESFARAVGATLCCSRPVADKGWLPKSRQVGTSGSVVKPKLYLAFGISGAYQHVAGMRQAETIIAVNKDPSAPIFEVAHYGIAADMFEVLPALQARLTRAS
ncbi:MAG: electron transfer flavoprotein subunit alpha/FixB family protein [Deltaproteobacteria bacterium]|nr:electron transfer flavoprotein subunit alpha/FixB family protein [Deltaproteobacteria bacterium]